MKVILATIGARKSSAKGPINELVELYVERSQRYIACERKDFASEAAMLSFVDERAGRTAPAVILTDSRGQQVTSEELAVSISSLLDSGKQLLLVAIGPPDGWAQETVKRATLTIAFGRITLPHELAAVVTAEQVYRALTIRAGHPYHSGH